MSDYEIHLVFACSGIVTSMMDRKFGNSKSRFSHDVIDVSVGEWVCALSQRDKQWYRAVVIDGSKADGVVKVVFLIACVVHTYVCTYIHTYIRTYIHIQFANRF